MDTSYLHILIHKHKRLIATGKQGLNCQPDTLLKQGPSWAVTARPLPRDQQVESPPSPAKVPLLCVQKGLATHVSSDPTAAGLCDSGVRNGFSKQEPDEENLQLIET